MGKIEVLHSVRKHEKSSYLTDDIYSDQKKKQNELGVHVLKLQMGGR